MNKHFWKICFLTLTAINSFGQIKFQYGPKIGVTESWIHIVNNIDNITTHQGLDIVGGVFLRASKGRFEIQPEVYYQNLGGSFKFNGGIIFRNNYQYISVPLLLGYRPVEGVTLQVGPEYSRSLNSNTTYGPDQPNDFGIAAGVRIDMLDIASLFSVNFRYTAGLQNITDKFGSKNTALDFRNQSIQVAFSYNFSDYYNWYRKHKKKK